MAAAGCVGEITRAGAATRSGIIQGYKGGSLFLLFAGVAVTGFAPSQIQRFIENRIMQALLLVDIQNDFLPGGSLPVPRGDEVIAVANRLMSEFEHVVASLDWHPRDHGSFASQHAGVEIGGSFELAGHPQIAWPDHCVQGTPGAELPESLDRDKIAYFVHKGTVREVDSYSAFFDNDHRHATGLHDYLQSQGVDELSVMGLATDYCVKYTVQDAIALGYRTRVLLDGCRGVNLLPSDTLAAVEVMRNAGAELVRGDQETV